MSLFYTLMLTVSLQQLESSNVDPASISEVDAINCRLDVPSYMQFAMAIGGEQKLAQKRRWKKTTSRNTFMNEYDLPQPIVVAGTYSTRRIAFTGDAILAILDLPDPAVLGRREQVDNAMSAEPLIDALVTSGKMSRSEAEAAIPFRKFLGERIIKDITDPAGKGESYGSRTVVARTISNATTHPGRTFYGCTYRLEMLDEDGTPL
ncbi:hypothetical protein [Sphingomonas endolithica]|uniref:hypothetical protein n=1 Tax=Sphingomonas endolithica TaxID=2972485 RepID=UPI0021AEEE20|nr:hypothetical protein [Sphingomonas sp. ZFBP2030]